MKPVLLQGYLFAAAASLCYGVATVITKTVVREVAPPLVTSVFTLSFGLLFLSLFLSPRLGQQIREVNSRRGYLFFVTSGVAAGVGVTSMYFALRVAPVVVVSPVTATHPLFALLLSYFFLRSWERLTPKIVLGAFLVVLGVVLVTLSQG